MKTPFAVLAFVGILLMGARCTLSKANGPMTRKPSMKLCSQSTKLSRQLTVWKTLTS
jgi:hypothetical protein